MRRMVGRRVREIDVPECVSEKFPRGNYRVFERMSPPVAINRKDSKLIGEMSVSSYEASPGRIRRGYGGSVHRRGGDHDAPARRGLVESFRRARRDRGAVKRRPIPGGIGFGEWARGSRRGGRRTGIAGDRARQRVPMARRRQCADRASNQEPSSDAE